MRLATTSITGLVQLMRFCKFSIDLEIEIDWCSASLRVKLIWIDFKLELIRFIKLGIQSYSWLFVILFRQSTKRLLVTFNFLRLKCKQIA